MKNHGFGALIEPRPVRDYKYDLATGYQPRTDLPPEYTIDADRLPPIHDQGRTGMCVAFAMCEIAECEADNENHFAPAWNYGRVESRGAYTGEGLFVSRALDGVVKIGFVPGHYFPFSVDVPDVLKYAAERDDLLAVGERQKPAAYVAFEYAYKDKLWDCARSALVDYACPILLLVPDYFGGGHAVMAYGYVERDGERYFKIQNSWGESWGKGGRGEIPLYAVEGAYALLWETVKLPFEDVSPDDWFYDDVKAAYLSGLIEGVSDTEFAPNESIKRADVAVIIDRLLSAVENSANTFGTTVRQAGGECSDVEFWRAIGVFEDVCKTDYFYDAVGRVSVNEIIRGRDAKTFAPNDAITRAELAAVAARTVDIISRKLSEAFEKKCEPETVPFKMPSDVKSVDWYADDVYYAYRYGLMNGYEDGTFRPDNYLSRAEASAILNRVFRQTDKMLQGLAVVA